MIEPLKKPKKRGQNEGRSKWSRFRKRYLAKHEQWGGWFECSSCLNWFKAEDIDLDHIRERSLAPDLVYDESNIRLSCRECHNQRHQKAA